MNPTLIDCSHRHDWPDQPVVCRAVPGDHVQLLLRYGVGEVPVWVKVLARRGGHDPSNPPLEPLSETELLRIRYTGQADTSDPASAGLLPTEPFQFLPHNILRLV